MPRIEIVRFDGQVVRAAIADRRLTPTQLAARARVSERHIHNLVSGRPIGRRTAIAVARVLRRSLGSLVHELVAGVKAPVGEERDASQV